MRIHHIRNATMLIESGDKVILVDPMLSAKGKTGPPFTLFRHKPKRNPIVHLPEGAMAVIEKTTHCLITHLHPDHLDKTAETFLKSKNIPVICSIRDAVALKKRRLNVVQPVEYWETSPFLGGTIEGVPARHGYGFVAKPMGNVMGYFIKLPNEKSVYLSSDTIYTDDVDKVLKAYNPDISVVASGSAQLDFFQPLLMRMDDIIRFVENAPHKVIANHLEAVNHCPTTRIELLETLKSKQLNDRVFIPDDGDMMEF